MSTTFTRERTLQDEIAPAVESRVPGVEVLAVELPSTNRLRVYIDHEGGVDHALRKREHFADAIGERVSVRAETRKNRYRGILTEAGDDTITLDTGDAAEVHI